MKVLVLAVGLAALTGCTKTVAEMSYSERQALAQQIVLRCQEQGVKSGTSEMEACTAVETQREIASRERAARIEDARLSRRSGPRMCQTFGNTVTCF